MIKRYIDKTSQFYWAFNAFDIQSAQAILDGAARENKSAIIQTSMKAFSSIDKECLRFIITEYNKSHDGKVYLHLDHCREVEMIKQAIECGWDSVMIDASDKPIEENIRITNEVSFIAHESGVLVETEIGKIHKVSEDKNETADIRDVTYFLDSTDIDMIAVAIGTSHGMYKGNPHIDYDLVEQVGRASMIPMVVHGGTGLSTDTFKKLLSYKHIKKINISTDIKLAYRKAIMESYENDIAGADSFDPIIVDHRIHNEIADTVVRKLRL